MGSDDVTGAVESVALPEYRMAGRCCCPEHPHNPYRRTAEDGFSWIECHECGAIEDAPAVQPSGATDE